MKEIVPKKISSKFFSDERGYIEKIYDSEFFDRTLNFKPKQVLFSYNKKKGTIRGMHYQRSPYSESKILKCINGKIYDVCIDLNKKSKSYMKKYIFTLDSKKNEFLYIPKNFAHGFQSLVQNTLLVYVISGIYSKNYEVTKNPLDNNLDIQWPLKISNISEKDSNACTF